MKIRDPSRIQPLFLSLTMSQTLFVYVSSGSSVRSERPWPVLPVATSIRRQKLPLWLFSLSLVYFTKSFNKILFVQFSSVAQSCLTLCDPMNRSTPGLPVHHQLPEFTQTHVHRVRDAIQPSHPLSSPSPAPNPSQHQSLFQWVNSSHEVAKVLELQL